VGVGDLVSFRIPSQEGQMGVKRIIGMPGDYVLMGTPGERGQDKMIQVRGPEGLYLPYISGWEADFITGSNRTLLSCW
jgi:hypothetical protein